MKTIQNVWRAVGGARNRRQHHVRCRSDVGVDLKRREVVRGGHERRREPGDLSVAKLSKCLFEK